MEAVLLSDHQSMAACNYSGGKASALVANNFIHRQHSGNLFGVHGSIIGAPPSRSSSFSSPFSSFSSSSSSSPGSLSPQRQPPLLPLPSARIPALTSLPPPPKNRKGNSSMKYPTEELKRAKSLSFSPKKEPSRPPAAKAGRKTAPSPPSPAEIDKEMQISSAKASTMTVESEVLNGSIFSVSPPPSSLPIPKFSLRPKIRCKAEAAGANIGAEDDLRRLLRIE